MYQFFPNIFELFINSHNVLFNCSINSVFVNLGPISVCVCVCVCVCACLSYKAICQKQLRLMENEWWLRRPQEIQRHVDANNAHAFYNTVKSLHGPQK